MGIHEKILNAKKTTWLTEGMTDTEIKATVELARISAKIERCRLELEMTQKEFADYMGVTQGMVSRWESREYNFTVRSLNEICQKLGLSLTMEMEEVCSAQDYKMVKWNVENEIGRSKDNSWIIKLNTKEAIA